MSEPLPLESVFDIERIRSSSASILLLAYCPIGMVLFLIRIFIGIHAFLIACLLRKTTKLRAVVLRIMCTVLGIVVWQNGCQKSNVKVMCSNHVSPLDHLALDMLEPCILPSVWDIPSVLRWCLGYQDLGLRKGRDEFIKQTKLYIQNGNLPILSFPEGSITNGRLALLKFSTWPMEVSSEIQPISIKIWRPANVSISLLGSSWYTDIFWFLFLPFTIIYVEWLPVISKNEEESTEDFSKRISQAIASNLSLSTSNITNQDAVDAAKRNAKKTPAINSAVKIDSRKLDDLAMKIKQSYPAVPVYAIRQDLDRTMNPKETVERIKNGKLSLSSLKSAGKMTTNPGDWRRLFESRKWGMIETNRARYLEKAQAYTNSKSS